MTRAITNDEHNEHGHMLVQAQLQLVPSKIELKSKIYLVISSKNWQPSNLIPSYFLLIIVYNVTIYNAATDWPHTFNSQVAFV